MPVLDLVDIKASENLVGLLFWNMWIKLAVLISVLLLSKDSVYQNLIFVYIFMSKPITLVQCMLLILAEIFSHYYLHILFTFY